MKQYSCSVFKLLFSSAKKYLLISSRAHKIFIFPGRKSTEKWNVKMVFLYFVDIFWTFWKFLNFLKFFTVYVFLWIKIKTLSTLLDRTGSSFDLSVSIHEDLIRKNLTVIESEISHFKPLTHTVQFVLTLNPRSVLILRIVSLSF
jgi:hypothetical protein